MDFDLAIIGGGINGACVARDAAGRDLRVLLVERDDLGGHAASGSPKIIHGGQRFLRLLELSLARSAQSERDYLLRNAPHLVHPVRFVVPQLDGASSRWALRLESLVLNHLARDSELPGSRVVELARHPAGGALKNDFSRALECSDAWTDDARLVIANCLDAARRGATILPRTECTACERGEDVWRLCLRSGDGDSFEVGARAVVNAAGPWAAKFLAERNLTPPRQKMQLVKGSHIVVPRLFEHPYAYVFESADKRLLMALPYENDYTLIGPCESDYHGDVATPRVTADETAWLCEQVNAVFNQTIDPSAVVCSYSGVRGVPVAEDAEAAMDQKHDYVLSMDSDGPPIVSVFGGRATTCRILAEQVLNCIQPALGLAVPAWTEGARLPGGEIPDGDLTGFIQRLIAQRSDLPATLLARMARAYGTRVVRIIGSAYAPKALGAEIAPGLHEAELEYLVNEEWAVSAQDVLWRRSKLGLHYDEAACAAVAAWLATRVTTLR